MSEQTYDLTEPTPSDAPPADPVQPPEGALGEESAQSSGKATGRGSRFAIHFGHAWEALTSNPKAAVVQSMAAVWGVAIMLGLFSPIKGFEQETLELVERSEVALRQHGMFFLPPDRLEQVLADRVKWRQEHVAKWNRGLAFVVAVCLGIGVLGSMNTALSQLKDRVRELAIRKVCGASNRDLYMQVLIEGAITSTVGGAVGIVAGLGLSRIGTELIELPYRTSPGLIALGFALAFASGLLAALWPASRAARLQPVQALREL